MVYLLRRRILLYTALRRAQSKQLSNLSELLATNFAQPFIRLSSYVIYPRGIPTKVVLTAVVYFHAAVVSTCAVLNGSPSSLVST